jgi:hypothetical protein
VHQKAAFATIAAMLQGILIAGLEMDWLEDRYAHRVSVSFLEDSAFGCDFAYGQRWQAFRWYAPYSFAYHFAYHFCVPAYRYCVPNQTFSPLPDSPFSNAVFIAYITETRTPARYADSMAPSPVLP